MLKEDVFDKQELNDINSKEMNSLWTKLKQEQNLGEDCTQITKEQFHKIIQVSDYRLCLIISKGSDSVEAAEELFQETDRGNKQVITKEDYQKLIVAFNDYMRGLQPE